MNTSAYVYFIKETGEIASIGNIKKEDSPLSFIEVPHEEVKPILIGRDRLRDYKVSFNIKLSEYVFSPKIDVHEAISMSWDESIFQIPRKNTNSTKYDIIVRESKNHRSWSVAVSDRVISAYAKTSDTVYSYFDLYITRQDDANVLLHTLSINTFDLLKGKRINFENVDIAEPTSVYCKKIFDRYIHIIK